MRRCVGVPGECGRQEVGRNRCRRQVLCLLLAWVSVAIAVSPAGADWTHPVDAAVIDPYRPPAHRFGSGNRGLEYATAGGETVVASDEGVVVFAGVVGRRRHVVVDHGDGLRSTYAYVSTISVVRGQRVARGQKVAVAGPGFHLTARLGSDYVDPMLLIEGAEVVVALVDGPSPLPPNPRRSPLNPLLAVVDAADDLRLSRQFGALADAARQWHHRDCTGDDTAPPDPSGRDAMEHRVLIQVGGLGTSSEGASISGLDHGALGYDPDNVVGFSYAGGCTPAAFGGGTGELNHELGGSSYTPSDTFRSIEESAILLADLIDAVALHRPGQPVDIAAHSLGGVVSRRALEILADRGSARAVGVMLTIGSPHRGTDLATAAVAIAGSSGAAHLDPLIGEGAAFRLAESVVDIAEAGGGGVIDPAPPPSGVAVIAVAGASDLVVPGERAVWAGATNVVVPTSTLDAAVVHGRLPSMPEVRREMELALAGMAPRCVGLATVLGAALQGRAISAMEDGATLLAGLARWVF